MLVYLLVQSFVGTDPARVGGSDLVPDTAADSADTAASEPPPPPDTGTVTVAGSSDTGPTSTTPTPTTTATTPGTQTFVPPDDSDTGDTGYKGVDPPGCYCDAAGPGRSPAPLLVLVGLVVRRRR